MVAAAQPINEAARMQELLDLNILDTLPEDAYDDIALLASQICDTPIALISLVDDDRQWFKSRVGIDDEQTSRDVAFCAHAILDPHDVLVVPDATVDPRFIDNPLVTGDLSVRFYAGAPLTTAPGHALGTLCVVDRKPRTLTDEQRAALEALARQVVAQFELRRTVADLAQKNAEQLEYERQLEDYQRTLEIKLAEIAELSRTDTLTGLHNRRALFERLEEECLRISRRDAPLSFALVDVDGFKTFNDTFGHPAGDEALKSVAATINDACRTSDFVARLGGDEFAVVFPNTGTEGAQVLARRIRRRMAESELGKLNLTVSIGVTTAGEDTSTASSLLAAADRALYDAKGAGRDRVAMVVSV